MANDYKFSADSNRIIDFLVEKDKQLSEQINELNKARQNLTALVQDVVNTEVKTQGISGDGWTVNLESRQFVKKEDEKKEEVKDGVVEPTPEV